MSLINYRPFEERTVDTQYQELLHRILHSGQEVMTRQGAKALRIIGHELRFKLANGFPIITERNIVSTRDGKEHRSGFRQALAEICAFLNGAQTLAELEEFGCFWWKDWATPEKCIKRGLMPGDLGPGSYGAAFRRFPTSDRQPFDQISSLVDQMRRYPEVRTHLVVPWIPQYITRAGGRKERTVLAPCHGEFFVDLVESRRQLTLTHVQRSADVPVGLPYNLIHYAALTMMLAQVMDYTADELIFFIHNAHIYTAWGDGESQLPKVARMLKARVGKFPTVTLDASVRDIFKFRPGHFTITNYEPKGPRLRIPTPV